MRNIIIKYSRLIILAISLLCIFAGLGYKEHLINDISMKQPDKRWSSKELKAGYVAAYFSENDGLSEDDVTDFKHTYDSDLKSDSFESNGKNRLYVEAYSTEGEIEVTKKLGGKAVKVNVTALGGDYFMFHPMQLLYGNYISGNDLMKDGVVLDENAAWHLYGSSDIVGRYVYINNESYYVTGVVKGPSGRAARKAYGGKDHIYMHFSKFAKSGAGGTGVSAANAGGTGVDGANAGGTGVDGANENGTKITCYEVLFPDMINNYAYNKIKNALGISSENGDSANGSSSDATDSFIGISGKSSVYSYGGSDRDLEIINMSRRFKTASLWQVLKSYGRRSMKTTGIKYPYWENECRMTEDFASLTLIWNGFFGIVLILTLIGPAVNIGRGIKHTTGRIIKKIKYKFAFK